MIFKTRFKKNNHVTLLIEAETKEAAIEIKKELRKTFRKCKAKPSYLMKIDVIQE